MGSRISSGATASLHAIWVAAAALALVAGVRRAEALETDQFTVPSTPLADIGPELASEVMARIDAAVVRVNARAASHARRAEAARGFWRRHHLRERNRQLSERTLALEVYRGLAGPGLPECRIERWVRSHPFERGPARFEMTCAAGAYGPSPLGRSPFLMSLSPTVNVFGVHCGADKIGHVFQQGYQYFEGYLRAESGGGGSGGEALALAAAVQRGVDQERGFYGQALVGVYSNADLAANYAGLKLYLNLTRPVRVGDDVRPPAFVLRAGRWEANATSAVHFLRPFISEHFNEALNPSRYSQPTRGTVRTRWRERAESWVAFYASTRQAEAERSARLAKWHGEAYGHSGFGELVTAADTCFGPAHAAARAPVRPFAGRATPVPPGPRVSTRIAAAPRNLTEYSR